MAAQWQLQRAVVHHCMFSRLYIPEMTYYVSSGTLNLTKPKPSPWAALEISFRGAEQGRQGGKHMMGRTCDLTLQKTESIRNKRRFI